MTFMPIYESLSSNSFANRLRHLRLIATDMDGTLTRQGRFCSGLLESLEALAAAGWPVLIVTGRSAGWVQGLVHYLPVVGAIAENGGLFYSPTNLAGEILTPLADPNSHRHRLDQQFRRLQQLVPQLQETADNRHRITDWTFDVQGLTSDQLAQLQQACLAAGWGFTYSTVQCHIRPLEQDKGAALRQVLQRFFPQVHPHHVLTIGDSPNDESLFEARTFPTSVGVANVLHYQDRLTHMPAFVTTHPEVAGFRELTQYLLGIQPEDKPPAPEGQMR